MPKCNDCQSSFSHESFLNENGLCDTCFYKNRGCVKCKQQIVGGKWNEVCANCVNAILYPLDWKEKTTQKINELEQSLQTEQQAHQDALRTSQEWHERQKREIIEQKDQEINQLKQQHQNYLNSRKTQITQETTLLKNILGINET